MRSVVVRSIYRFLLRHHPTSFRERFGAEMLWIYDEEAKHGVPVRLLCDGVLSLLRQHIKAHQHPEPVPAGFGLISLDSGIGPQRIFQALLLALMLLVSVLVSAHRDYPSHFWIHHPTYELRCIFQLQASSHIESPPHSFKLSR